MSDSAPTITSVVCLDNLVRAARSARKRKSRRPDVEEWHLREESHLLRLAGELETGRWRPAAYRTFTIREPKRRLIAAAPYEDRVVYHALCAVLNPVLQARFLARSFSCQEGKGTGAARGCCRRLTNRFSYVLKCDVRKFYDSIPHPPLYEKLAALTACARLRKLVWRIIDSYEAAPGRGIPIGNLTSQWWGNFYLDGLDHWVAEAQAHGAYLRYTDDFLLFDDSKARLWDLHGGIEDHLRGLSLSLAKPKSRLLACREGVPFCGFRFFPGRQPRILGATKRRFEARRRRLVRKRDYARLSVSTFAWYQFSLEANSTGLRRAWAVPRKRSE